MADAAAIVVLGRVVGAHGVNGRLRIKPYTGAADAMLDYPQLLVGKPHGGAVAWQAMKVLGGRVHGDGLIVELDGVADRDQALALRGAEVGVARAALPPVDDDELYLVDLVGAAVVDTAGASLGRIAGFVEVGTTQVMRVVDAAGAAERLIPFVPLYVVDVDVDTASVTVDWADPH